MRFALVVLFWCSSLFADTYALKGTLVTPDSVIENGVLLVRDGVIVAADANVALPEDVMAIDSGGFIYPGLIDLHNHLTWNVLRRWSAGTLTRNRYEWQAMDSYSVGLRRPQSLVFSYGCDAERFGEVKALVWGATSVTGSLPKDCSRGLARNLDYANGLGTDVQYRVFPLELNPNDEKSVRDALAAKNAVIVHLAEGVDASAAREFRMASAHGFFTEGFVIIHGVPLVESDWKTLGEKGVGFVWSPRSNIELYGRTADAATAAKYVTTAIAPDWSPSGSNGMIDELHYASLLTTAFTPKQLVQMATTSPAKLARLDAKIGRLAPGLVADYVVVRRGARTDPYETLIYASPGDVSLVAVNGRPLYGDAALMQRVNPSARAEPLTVYGFTKAVDTSDSDNGAGVTWADTMKNLTAAFSSIQVPLAGLAECECNK